MSSTTADSSDWQNAAEPLLLTNARRTGGAGQADSGRSVDLLIQGGVIREVRPAGEFGRTHGAVTCDAGGRTVLPGLWDHHVHFTQWVIQQQRIDVSAGASAAEVLTQVAAAAARSTEKRLTGFGFRDGLWPDVPTLTALDTATGALPTVLVSADLHCVWVNTAAQRDLGVCSDASGLLRETEAFEVLERLESAAELTTGDYRRAAATAAARGVVGVVDFENDDNAALWPQRVSAGVDSLRVEIAAWPDKLEGVITRGLKTGDVLDPQHLITMGPLKVIVDGSLNTRTAWCWDPYPGLGAGDRHRCGVEAVPVEELSQLLERAKETGISAAVHAIGDRANTEVLDAFAALGMTGRVEHAQLLREADVPRFAELGLEASVQPEHAMDDRDVAEAFWQGRTHRSFMLRSLHESGAVLRLGSDAPVSPLDPWIQMAAAVTRSRDGREPWHPEQAITVGTALGASTRGGISLQQGDSADLVLTEEDPLSIPGEQLREMPVAATILGGRFTHSSL